MLTSAILFASLSGLSAATWTICLKLGASRINPALGAMIVTGVALVVNTIVMLSMRASGQEIAVRWVPFALFAVAGVAASGVDIFLLLAYERGLRVSSTLVVSGVSTTVVLLVGFLAFREPFTPLRFLAIVMIASGVLLLQAQDR